MKKEVPLADQLLTPAELGRIMRIEPRQIMRWAQEGRIRFTRTPGGHRRYFLEDVLIWQRGEVPDGWVMRVAESRKKKEAADDGTD
jgi:excisionase family DNA binding protein